MEKLFQLGRLFKTSLGNMTRSCLGGGDARCSVVHVKTGDLKLGASKGYAARPCNTVGCLVIAVLGLQMCVTMASVVSGS